MAKCDVKQGVFVPSPLAECLYLFSEDKRKTCNILLDVGYSSSTLSIVHNAGIVFQHTFSLGGALISGSIMQNYAPEGATPEKLMIMLFDGAIQFLQKAKTTLIPLITIPVSLIATFAVLYALGFDINILTLFCIALFSTVFSSLDVWIKGL